MKKISKAQAKVLERISSQGPVIKTYNNETGEDYYSLANSARSVDKRVIKSLFAMNKLLPCNDGLFGDSQTYVGAN